MELLQIFGVLALWLVGGGFVSALPLVLFREKDSEKDKATRKALLLASFIINYAAFALRFHVDAEGLSPDLEFLAIAIIPAIIAGTIVMIAWLIFKTLTRHEKPADKNDPKDHFGTF